ncbi:TlyA family RNA methyltransferase [Rhodoligotrophos defluvii]|uniref:TlyA family RNA methyltransferase n=1 Tax=Rhodoligotrophos defluvii TaxID=2561934 RepID=UPI0010C9AC0A|nr:TlyA family RNA methyltransferase [Rhodoligotrophos defluvii]
MAGKCRLDHLLFSRGLVASRARAKEAIARGLVQVDGQVARKPGAMVSDNAQITLTGDPSLAYVSRAALKLAHGLDHFAIPVAGRIALDIGASTGGFTHVLLERGAARVYAVDVGHGQLHPIIASDPRVIAFEGLNARDLDPSIIPEMPQLIVCDVSFISLTLALPAALALAAGDADLVALIKPQFEVGPQGLGKGGIVRDATLHAGTCERIRLFLESRDWHVLGVTPSPITGGDGNKEFIVAAQRHCSTIGQG